MIKEATRMIIMMMMDQEHSRCIYCVTEVHLPLCSNEMDNSNKKEELKSTEHVRFHYDVAVLLVNEFESFN